MNTIPLRVRDYMTREPLTVAPHVEITQVVRMLIDHDVSGALVVDDAGALLGVLTERDCIAVASGAGYYDEWGGPARDYMSSPVETVAPDDNLVDVAVRMTNSHFRRFPVLENERVVGLISRRDVLKALGSGSWFAKED
jgi:CBS domain-containing protein